MAHHVYLTEGMVLDKRAVGEWDVRVSIFTKDLGLVLAVVKGYRRPASKLRAHIGLYSHIEVGLVRGREVWRVVFAQNTGLTSFLLKQPTTKRLVGQTVNILKRLVRGQEPQPELFNDLKAGLQYLKPFPEGEDRLLFIEYIMVLRILYHLGYVPDLPELRGLTSDFSWETALAMPFSSLKPHLVKTINMSLKATHL